MPKNKNKHKCRIWKAHAGYWNAICFHKKCRTIHPYYFTWTDALEFVIWHQTVRGVK